MNKRRVVSISANTTTSRSNVIQSFSELEGILQVTGVHNLPETFCQVSECGGRRVEVDDDEDDDHHPSSRICSAITFTKARPLKNNWSSKKNKTIQTQDLNLICKSQGLVLHNIRMKFSF